MYNQVSNQNQNKSQLLVKPHSRNTKEHQQALYQGKRSVDCDNINVLSSTSKQKEEPQSS